MKLNWWTNMLIWGCRSCVPGNHWSRICWYECAEAEYRAITGHEFVGMRVQKLRTGQSLVTNTLLWGCRRCVPGNHWSRICWYECAEAAYRAITGHEYVGMRVQKMCAGQSLVTNMLVWRCRRCVPDSHRSRICWYECVEAVYRAITGHEYVGMSVQKLRTGQSQVTWADTIVAVAWKPYVYRHVFFTTLALEHYLHSHFCLNCRDDFRSAFGESRVPAKWRVFSLAAHCRETGSVSDRNISGRPTVLNCWARRTFTERTVGL
jgi:hypothetical protein